MCDHEQTQSLRIIRTSQFRYPDGLTFRSTNARRPTPVALATQTATLRDTTSRQSEWITDSFPDLHRKLNSWLHLLRSSTCSDFTSSTQPVNTHYPLPHSLYHNIARVAPQARKLFSCIFFRNGNNSYIYFLPSTRPLL